MRAAAKVRSSSGRSAARPAAMRSMTAMWSVSLRRSAPAALSSGRLERLHHRVEQCVAAAYEDHHVAFADRPRLSRVAVDDSLSRTRQRPSSRYVSATRFARIAGGRPVRCWSSGRRQSSGVGAGPRLIGGQARRRPSGPRIAVCAGGGAPSAAAKSRARPPRGRTSCRPRRGSSATTGTKGQRHFGERQAGVAMTLGEKALHLSEHLGRGALEARRSTASRRRPRRPCGRATRAPAPAKNSALNAARIPHCAAEASWASSSSR